jgi:uncharacterized protein (TIGR00730 family)
VISGGGPGLMEAANEGAHGGRSPAVGLNIALPNEQARNRYQDISRYFRYFFARKRAMAQRVDAFVVLPGGYGTLEEMFEMVTWLQLQLQSKPVGIYNIEGYFDRLLDFVRHAADEGFIRREHWDLLIVEHTPELLIDRLELHGRQMQRSHPKRVDSRRS